MQIRGTPWNLVPGEPHCAPEPAVLSESYVSLIRVLHRNSNWTQYVNACLMERLACQELLPKEKSDGEPTAQMSEGMIDQLCDEVGFSYPFRHLLTSCPFARNHCSMPMLLPNLTNS